jgi:hypothetical protein
MKQTKNRGRREEKGKEGRKLKIKRSKQIKKIKLCHSLQSCCYLHAELRTSKWPQRNPVS